MTSTKPSTEKGKTRGDLGIPYDEDVLRLIDVFRSRGFLVGSVVLTQYANQPAADAYRHRLEQLGVTCRLHYPIAGYPHDIERIVSDDGYGKNEYIETTRPLVVVTAPGPGSGKLATCLSQLYHEHQRGIDAGYAKYETFPIWNLPLNHPVNIAYEAATVDLDDANIIDPFHLEAYGETTVNYNRDVEAFPVLKAMMERIMGESPYQSPTDMGVNMAGYAIVDDDACRDAARLEIVRDEMDAAGAQELMMPIMVDAELWRESGRIDAYGKELVRFDDRHGREFVLGPTHEETVTALVRNELRSYKQLPVNLYHIQDKFRDEFRPRFGLMRGREFSWFPQTPFSTCSHPVWTSAAQGQCQRWISGAQACPSFSRKQGICWWI